MDARHKGVEARFGRGVQSVELDALDPARLRGLVRECIERHIPEGVLKQAEREERLAREALFELADRWAV